MEQFNHLLQPQGLTCPLQHLSPICGLQANRLQIFFHSYAWQHTFLLPEKEHKIWYCSSRVRLLERFMGIFFSTQRCEEFSPSNISVLAEAYSSKKMSFIRDSFLIFEMLTKKLFCYWKLRVHLIRSWQDAPLVCKYRLLIYMQTNVKFCFHHLNP